MKGAGKINFSRLLSIEGRGGRALKVEPRKTNKQRDPILRRSHRNVTIRYVIYMMGQCGRIRISSHLWNSMEFPIVEGHLYFSFMNATYCEPLIFTNTLIMTLALSQSTCAIIDPHPSGNVFAERKGAFSHSA